VFAHTNPDGTSRPSGPLVTDSGPLSTVGDAGQVAGAGHLDLGAAAREVAALVAPDRSVTAPLDLFRPASDLHDEGEGYVDHVEETPDDAVRTAAQPAGRAEPEPADRAVPAPVDPAPVDPVPDGPAPAARPEADAPPTALREGPAGAGALVAVTQRPEPPELHPPGPAPGPAPEPEPDRVPPARVALVTGAGRGIGRALALGLGRAGISVALLGRSPGPLEDVAAQVASYGVDASWAGADVRDYAQVQNAVQRLEAAVGDIDLLINNAGVIEPVEVPVWDAGPETWWHVVETDLRGPFHCVRVVVPGMVARGAGRVINLSSGVGAGDRDIYSAYAAAKAGLFRITGSLHLAGYDRGLRAFEVSPGTVRTDMTAGMNIHSVRRDWTPVERVVDLVLSVASGTLDPWSGGYLRAGVDTAESLDAAEHDAGERGLPPWSRRLGILPYGPQDPLNADEDGA